jgi:hypothetical protein
MRADLGFSTALGARFSSARLERALRGFLWESRLDLNFTDYWKCDLHLTQHLCEEMSKTMIDN